MTWQELATHDLKMYTTTWCPDCKRFKRILAKHDIDVPEIDIDADSAAAKRLEEKTGRTAIPFLEIDGGPMVRGWHTGAPGGLDEALFLKEVAEALGE
jgi:glutaredoxin